MAVEDAEFFQLGIAITHHEGKCQCDIVSYSGWVATRSPPWEGNQRDHHPPISAHISTLFAQTSS